MSDNADATVVASPASSGPPAASDPPGSNASAGSNPGWSADAPAGAGPLPETEVPGARPPPPPAPGGPLAPGVVLSSTFEIEHLVARGGMGEVYRARHRITGDPIAIKTIRPELAGDEKIAELFKREAQALRGIRHPAIVSYEGVFDDGTGQLYIAMEFVDGPSLSKLMQNGPLAPADVRRLRDRVADGLAAAHAQGVIHRDLSPDNVILPGGRIDAAKLIDFGIAKQTESSKATVIGNDFAGKYSYAAPEQLGLQGGEVGPRADVYSLGLVLAAAASGAPLNMGNALPSAVAARMRVPDLGALPAELRAEITSMLQPDPSDRPQSMAELVGRTGTTQVQARSERSSTRARSGAGPLVAGIAVAVVVLLGGGAFLMKDRLFPPEPTPSPPGTTTATTSPTTPPGTTTTPPGIETPPATTAGKTATPGIESPPSTPGITTTPPATTTPPSSPPATSPPTTTATTTPPTTSPPSSPPPPSTGITTPEASTPPATTPPATTPPATTTATATPPQSDTAVIRSRLDALISRFDCADLTARVDSDLMVRLQGYVESDDDRSQLLAAARGIDGVRRVDAAVSVQPWPLCELVRVAAGSTSPDFRVVPNKLDRPYKIRADRVMFQVFPPAGRRGLLNVVFLNSDRTAWHYEPWSKIRVRPGQPETFGDKLSITLAPPVGKMAIIAVISNEPLFATPQAEEQPTKEYLAALRQALARHPDAIVSYVAFDTVD
ncbi:protein kinase domain-containing protein [Vineibacter terrae]|uniref:protein kinase domain-containing protein n=1 Tax=Vineibacter terrae TaxID=2586908 RepID=UPI002E2FDE78|nr:protein kinase [Vineibacter terrae]HEX2890244.1 protein kinase [Vineibacter terrae]